MKIGILTHPQGANYGGLLQCYAFSTYLKKMGHYPIVIRREIENSFFFWEWTRGILRLLHFPRYYNPNRVDTTVNIRSFIDKELSRTNSIHSQRQMRNICQEYGLEAVFVGSDQVWRHDYAMKFEYNYFLDFVPDNVIKASYAASFGLSDWLYTLEQTTNIKKYLYRFERISVREEDAITLCKENLSIDVQQMIDPTLLLTMEDYNKITSPRLINEKYVFVYWLGEQSQITGQIQKYLQDGYTIIQINLRDYTKLVSVEDWLSYIKYAEKVITDSFHGCVFSLIFQSTICLYQNDSGGVGRLSSLLKTLLIDDINNVNYETVGMQIQKFQKISSDYLK